MAIYTSRYSNPKLRSGDYVTVRISLGKPKWELGYMLHCEISALMPFGLLNSDISYEEFKRKYFLRLDKTGVSRLADGFSIIQQKYPGRDIVLLCYEDVRKPDDWCHRTLFAEWWKLNTGEIVEELTDTSKSPVKADLSESKAQNTISQEEQLTLF
jgi:hypothetical protein